MTPDVGADIESICGKCGDVWHVVVAKVGDKIVKVQCKQCGGVHRWRPPGGAPRASGAGASARPGGTRRSRAEPEPEPAPAIDPGAPSRRYSPGESYAEGEQLEHPTFGLGVVEQLLEPGKIQVFFGGGRKILAQAKPRSSLQRPPPGTFE